MFLFFSPLPQQRPGRSHSDANSISPLSLNPLLNQLFGALLNPPPTPPHHYHYPPAPTFCIAATQLTPHKPPKILSPPASTLNPQHREQLKLIPLNLSPNLSSPLSLTTPTPLHGPCALFTPYLLQSTADNVERTSLPAPTRSGRFVSRIIQTPCHTAT
jgi:hypothetical protein